jgi:hypothetical protein
VLDFWGGTCSTFEIPYRLEAVDLAHLAEDGHRQVPPTAGDAHQVVSPLVLDGHTGEDRLD